MPQTQPPVTASFVVQHLDSQGKVASQEHVSCVDVSEEILRFGLAKLHELGRNPEPILLGLQSFSLERTQYGGASVNPLTMVASASGIALFGLERDPDAR